MAAGSRIPAQEIRITDHSPSPDKNIRTIWRNDFFQSDEFWIIENYYDFFQRLKENKANNDIITLLKEQFKSNLPDELGTIHSFYSNAFHQNGGFIILSNEIKEEIPSRLLRKIYLYLYDNGHGPPSISNTNKDPLIKTIKKWKAKKKAKKKVKKKLIERIIKMNGEYHLPLTRDMWEFLPKKTKDEFIDLYTDPTDNTARESVKVMLKIRNKADIKEAASKYAGHRRPDAIERYLTKLLKLSSNGKITVPLEDILQPFIRDHLNRYHPKGGPNCYNSGLCVNQSRPHHLELLDSEELMEIRVLTVDSGLL